MATPPNTMTAFTDLMRVHATDLTPMVGNINDLYANQLNNGYFSRYGGPGTISGATAFQVIAPSLLEGAGTGLTLASNLFTLGVGVWEIKFDLRLSSALAMLYAIGISTNATAGDTGIFASGGFQSSANNAYWTANCSATVRSPLGTVTVGFKADARQATNPITVLSSRITFQRQSSA